jgi:hypothetical protein
MLKYPEKKKKKLKNTDWKYGRDCQKKKLSRIPIGYKVDLPFTNNSVRIISDMECFRVKQPT